MSWSTFWQILILGSFGWMFLILAVESLVERITEYRLERLERIGRFRYEDPELYYSSNRDSEDREM